ncbi:S49 family peptidase (plasmid) [Entomospira entomophila]|uniref:S49 family peptidase n=1 Tax=Entomospira entomophila TaxID=2719988 RepID=A0A968GAI6_9SPIO|nr:S49 family peptidase [Entomospira entomophilus]NIZ41517.1 S49 family peptidase [Entomospira entomophilus]WDI36399.1 S49 family peptidase [Entomospira entomophilus]
MNSFLLMHEETSNALLAILSQADSHKEAYELLAKSYTQPPVELAYSVVDGVAYLPVQGVLAKQVGLLDIMFNRAMGVPLPTTYGGIAQAIAKANADASIRAIVLQVDSGGGYVSGIDTAISAIRSSEKPITSEVHGMCASAAYWLASQTQQITASSRLSKIGSIGVMVQVFDFSESKSKSGVKIHTFRSSNAPKKALDPTDEGFNAQIQQEIDTVEAHFLADVALGRGVANETVARDYGTGGIFFAEQALKAGMIDAITALPSIDTSKSREGDKAMSMTKEEHEAVLAQAMSAERERVQGLLSISAKINKPAAHALVQEAIAQGKSKGDLVDEVIELKAMQSTQEAEGQGAGVINPPQVNPPTASEVDTPQAGANGMSAEDKASFDALEAFYKEQKGGTHG